jgi:hypothetical protein
MAEVTLPCGRKFLIDDADLPLLAGYNCYAHPAPNTTYVMLKLRGDERRTYVKLHKRITGWIKTDHRNGNGLDNRRENLREATTSQNNRNRRPNIGFKFKGVTFKKREGRWAAQICVDGKKIWGGYHPHPFAAASAYDVLAKKYHGEFALVNFPDE